MLASIAIATTATALDGRLGALDEMRSAVGTLLSALFLLIIGIANFFILHGVWAAFIRVSGGEAVQDEALDTLLAGRRLLARMFRPIFRSVSRSWHMYPIGFLFGLGFDTATEIGLLGIAATQAAQGMSVWTILVFPALFTAGMSLLDTTDSVVMVRAYGWAFVNSIRKLWYNMTITATSVTVAIFLGGVEALGLIGSKLRLGGAFWSLVGSLNDNLSALGYAVVGIFIANWTGVVADLPAEGLRSALTYSAATAGAVRRVLDRAVPTHSRLASSSTAINTRISSGWPRSMRKPNGTGVNAVPSGSPALTKPNTLPIWPGRRGVLQHDVAWSPAGAQRQTGGEHQCDDANVGRGHPVHHQRQGSRGDGQDHCEAQHMPLVGIGEPASDQHTRR